MYRQLFFNTDLTSASSSETDGLNGECLTLVSSEIAMTLYCFSI